jgi:hypothetical protein
MAVLNVKPKNLIVDDLKPNNRLVNRPTQVFTDNRTYKAGQSMGLLLALTYPTAGTWNNAVRL